MDNEIKEKNIVFNNDNEIPTDEEIIQLRSKVIVFLFFLFILIVLCLIVSPFFMQNY